MRLFVKDTLNARSSLANLSRLKYEMQTNKPLREVADVDLDVQEWNKAISQFEGKGWFEVPWLLAECYMYRRIWESLLLAGLGSFDPFETQKLASYQASLGAARTLSAYVTENLREDIFSSLIQVAFMFA
jgi:hypothetical protein